MAAVVFDLVGYLFGMQKSSERAEVYWLRSNSAGKGSQAAQRVTIVKKLVASQVLQYVKCNVNLNPKDVLLVYIYLFKSAVALQ